MCFIKKTLAHSILLLTFLFLIRVSAQPKVVDAVHLTQISNFQTDYSIIDMKMSADGSNIVFASLCAGGGVSFLNTGPQIKPQGCQ